MTDRIEAVFEQATALAERMSDPQRAEVLAHVRVRYERGRAERRWRDLLDCFLHDTPQGRHMLTVEANKAAVAYARAFIAVAEQLDV